MKLIPLGELNTNSQVNTYHTHHPSPPVRPQRSPLEQQEASPIRPHSPGYAKPRKQKKHDQIDLSNFDFTEWTADIDAYCDNNPQMFATARTKKHRPPYDKRLKRKPVPGMAPSPLNIRKGNKSGSSPSKAGASPSGYF